METSDQLKALVREKYTEIAAQDKITNSSSCCGATVSCTPVYNIMSDSYDELGGYQSDADLGLGCGLPTEFAQIKEGDVVIDLGSGAGNDCFVARHLTGPTGKVIGIDFTPAMIERARLNADKLGFNNVEFRQGDIEKMPITSGVADVIVSNCVLNLVPNKAAVFAEMKRVLKPGGHFSISDVVLEGQLPETVKKTAELYAGCVSGAIQKDEYLSLIEQAGFTNITVQKQKTIEVPDEILREYLNDEELKVFRSSGTGIYSITVFAVNTAVCAPGSGCC
ncbi:MAG: arsenite methyltransferase [Bacteroidia bacterium]